MPRHQLCLLGVLALVIVGANATGCFFSGSSNGSGGAGGASGAGGGAATTPGAGGAPASLRWYATCGLIGCPDVMSTAVPCNSDEHEGAPCNYLDATCSARLPCGAFLLCTTQDPKGEGCP